MSDASRRDFLKTTSTAALTAGLVGSLSTRAFAAEDDTIKVGLVGCGGRGTGAAVQTLSSPGNVKLVAMADAFKDQIPRQLSQINTAVKDDETAMVDVPEERQFSGFDAYKEVLAMDDIDLVIFATPPGFRPIHFAAAVEAGKHVFMEKPVAVDAPGVRQVLEAAQKAKAKNLKVGVGLQRRHLSTYNDVISRIHDGAIGDVVALRVYWNGGGVWEPRKTREEVATEMEYQMRNWYYYNWLCGDHITEQHIHNLDIGCWIKDAYPVKAQGMGGRQVRTDKRYGEIFDHHAVEYTFEDGTKMFSQCRHIRNCWSSVTEHALGTKGYADLVDSRRIRMSDYDGSNEYIANKMQGEDPYQTEHNDLHAAIRADAGYNEAEYGAHSSMVSILGRMCTYSGKEITWEQAINSEKSIMPKSFAWDALPPTTPDENGEYPIPVPGVTKVV
ncbi:MAG: Gfo/Idh/MocA family oxidoreductase [Planctomycetaceae bacterium]|nr:Gfo/Idh/MocA family oxidoreductase [Planctomycetaceae bacterium]